ncbi:MAG: YkgJ family cysteine cluster protein [Bacteroidales bacterium]|nr:YkgJ family cysteine cluster protein [Bacteroidales bacterium]
MIKKLKKIKPKELDELFNGLHHEEFDNIDCLDCANCCKTLGPRLTNIDIERLSEFLKIKTSIFFERYIRIDEDNDYVFKSMPCPFLQDDNYCIVYKSRPRACREYPHTDRKNIKSILNICLKNTETCPVVANIFKRIERMI